MADSKPTELEAKLQLRHAQPIEVLDAPDASFELLRELPGRGAGDHGRAVLAFCVTEEDVVRHAAELVAAAHDADGLAWVAYPKRSSGVDTELSRDCGWPVLASEGLRPIREVALDETWSALRFRRREHVRAR